MKKYETIHKWLLTLSVAIMIALVFIMMKKINVIQGNARVVNYAGIVRGATQRLIKQELNDYQNDDLIQNLQSILDELQTGTGVNNLNKLDDEAYLKKLSLLAEYWKNLRQQIYSARISKDEREQLYTMSEEYFLLADETVSAAELYSDGIATSLHYYENVMVVDIIIVTLLLIIQAVQSFVLTKQNRKLKDMAYVDASTGLPNKHCCEDRLLEDGILAESRDVCCLMFDLNNLKQVNDHLGHKAGDALIVNFASVLRNTAPSSMFVGRFGGDEFIGIAKDTSEQQILNFLSALETNVKQLNTENQGITISYAYGYAMSSAYSGCTLRILLDKADQQMYENKIAMKKATGQPMR